MELDKKAVEEAFNYEVALDYVGEALPTNDEYDGDVEVYKVTEEGNLKVAFGAYTVYGAWEIMSDHEGYWAELKPVGGLTDEGLHADYELIAHGQA